DLGRRVQRRETPVVDGSLDRGIDVVVGEPEEAGADPAEAHVDQAPPAAVPALAPLRPPVVGGPELRQVALGLFAEKLHSAGDAFPSVAVKSGSGALTPVYVPIHGLGFFDHAPLVPQWLLPVHDHSK